MPKRTDIDSILIIGAGPITIGQACEFDYSGVQAVKALKGEGYRVILINSNPATLMTDPDLADATYIEPIRPEFIEKILDIEKPDAILPTMGGQTALNCALELAESGILAARNIELIGANARSIEMAEDRKLFVEAMTRINLECPRSDIVSAPEIRDAEGRLTGYDRLRGLHRAMQALEQIGLPAIIRPAFTLGGEGGGVAYNRAEFETIVRKGLEASPKAQILIDESLIGWKEFEMEVVRDTADNAIIVCSIENIDPMGVHTGDSITVAPALTLTDREYQEMRDAAFAVIREIGVETGGANVQFAVDPETGRQVVIEMNPRVSRSSALASKATGFPIAKIATQLAIGYTLDELDNDITRMAPASFEPVLDYIVTKIPRFAFEKYRGAEAILTTSMKSVGEAMAIGRNFAESLQKALRSLEVGISGLDETASAGASVETLLEAIARPSPDRLRLIADLFRAGASLEQIYTICRMDRWFLRQIADLVEHEQTLRAQGLPESASGWRETKAQGFSDARLAHLCSMQEEEVRQKRHALHVRPVFRRIDTCAGEFAASTPYLYSSYEKGAVGPDGDILPALCEAQAEDTQKAVIIGGGPNRIGQGLEFDYCCCHAAFAIAETGWQSIMINCNPETVSTDYDTSDRLYFEPLTLEDILEILHCEQGIGQLQGVIVQFGGQTPLKLAPGLQEAGIPILGTSSDSLDEAEDRGRFAALLKQIGLQQAPSRMAHNAGDAAQAAKELGYPVMLRPSNVLGGRAMEVVYNPEELHLFAEAALSAAEGSGLLIDCFLSDAIEIDVDALCDGKHVHIAGIMEHIEEAGIHSGDSACALPAHSLEPELSEELCRQTALLAKALKVKGLINVQFAIRNKQIFVLEANPRASRTVPFVAKAVGKPFARIAASVMIGQRLSRFGLDDGPLPVPRQAVKEAVFPFARFPGIDPSLGPEMRSTGEVMGIGTDFGSAYLKSQIGAGTPLPEKGACFISVRDNDKPAAADIARQLIALGFSLTATDGTCAHLQDKALPVQRVNKVRQGRPHIVDLLSNGEIQLVINTTQGARSLADSASIRQTALLAGVPYFTTLGGGRAALSAIRALRSAPLDTLALQTYLRY